MRIQREQFNRYCNPLSPPAFSPPFLLCLLPWLSGFVLHVFALPCSLLFLCPTLSSQLLEATDLLRIVGPGEPRQADSTIKLTARGKTWKSLHSITSTPRGAAQKSFHTPNTIGHGASNLSFSAATPMHVTTPAPATPLLTPRNAHSNYKSTGNTTDDLILAKYPTLFGLVYHVAQLRRRIVAATNRYDQRLSDTLTPSVKPPDSALNDSLSNARTMNAQGNSLKKSTSFGLGDLVD